MDAFRVVFALCLLRCVFGINLNSMTSFNIQVFGQTKVSNIPVLETLVQILRRFDLVAIQEVRDAQETAFPQLVQSLVSTSKIPYDSIIGPRVGKTTSKEQYGYIFDSRKFSVVQSYTYADPLQQFERPPFIVTWSVKNSPKQFSTINIHTKPENAVAEIDELVDVYDDAVSKLKNANVLILGDFNAGCSYVPQYRWASIRLFTQSRFRWLMETGTPTAVKTDCPYDRFVVAGDWLLSAASKGAVFNFMTVFSLPLSFAITVSDHFPITLNLTAPLSSEVPQIQTESAPRTETIAVWKLVVGLTVGLVALVAGGAGACLLYRRRCKKQASDPTQYQIMP